MNWNLNDKVALVTGGTKGIGLAITHEFLKLGAEVIVVARNTSTLPTSEKVHLLEGDLTDPGFRKHIIDFITKKWNKLDVLVNNVGTNVRKKFIDYSEEE